MKNVHIEMCVGYGTIFENTGITVQEWLDSLQICEMAWFVVFWIMLLYSESTFSLILIHYYFVVWNYLFHHYYFVIKINSCKCLYNTYFLTFVEAIFRETDIILLTVNLLNKIILLTFVFTSETTVKFGLLINYGKCVKTLRLMSLKKYKSKL